MGLLDRLLGKDYGSDGILTDDEKELRDYENHVYTFSGLSDVYELFMVDISDACEIPTGKHKWLLG